LLIINKNRNIGYGHLCLKSAIHVYHTNTNIMVVEMESRIRFMEGQDEVLILFRRLVIRF